MVVSEPADTCDCLIHGVIVHSSLAQHRVCHDRPGVAILDYQRRYGSVAGILRGEAIVHCNLRHI
eukprot:8331776-Alexandrium_andersonii.AAC.1